MLDSASVRAKPFALTDLPQRSSYQPNVRNDQYRMSHYLNRVFFALGDFLALGDDFLGSDRLPESLGFLFSDCP